jgi:hypothetical protein
MVTIENTELFNETLSPGGRAQSISLSCNTARAVQLSVRTGQQIGNVAWTLSFGPDSSNSFWSARSGTVGEDGYFVGIEVPVFGPELMVSVENLGDGPADVFGMIRIVHELE